MNALSDVDQSDSQTSGHAALISRDPLIVSTPAIWQSPLGLAETLGRRSADREVTFLIPLSWHCNEASAAAKAAAIKAHRSRFPAHELIVLGNTPEEVALLQAAGAKAFFANHNIFASEAVFHPLPDVNVEFDAVYNARPVPMKRHDLASLVERVAYISFVSPDQETLHSRDVVSDLQNVRPGHVLANQIVDGFPRVMKATAVNAWLARASVGLCLSEEEGAMYSSIEYLLAGLPIVSTPSRGGRDVFFDRDYCIIAEPDPRTIREAVEALRDRNIPRAYVRSRTLAKLTGERQRFLAFIDEIKSRHGASRDDRTEWTFTGAPFHPWRSVEQHAREMLGTTNDEDMAAAQFFSRPTSVVGQDHWMNDTPAVERPLDLRSAPLENVVRSAWEVGKTIDLAGIGYGRIHWGNLKDVRPEPVPYYFFLAGLARLCGAMRICEIGTHSGGSARALRRGMSSTQADLVTIDMTEISDPQLVGERGIRKIVGDAGSPAVIDAVREHFGAQRGIDVLFIDSDHQMKPTLDQYRAYVSALQPRFVVLDDIAINQGMAEAWRLVCEGVPTGEAVNVADIEPRARSKSSSLGLMRLGDSPAWNSVSRQRRVRETPSTVRRLVSFIGQDDSDILPFFLDHYRRLGIGAFHLMLDGTWSKAELAPLLAAGDVTIEGFNGEPYNDVLLTSSLDAMARQFEGEWVVIVDADEFLELPYASLSRTIDALMCLGMDELPASLLQRCAPDGELRSLAEGAPETLFPCYDNRLAERMDTEFPVWKSKYPLVRIGPKFRFAQGNHHPSNGRAAMHLPIRGVLHHFKWRDRLLRSLSRARGEVGKQQGNPEEQNAYHRWLEGHGQRVPTDRLKVYSRSELLREGHLIRPTRNEVRVWAALRKARQGRSAALASIPHALPQPDAGMGALDRIALRTLPGRIALVTTDLLGLRRTGGIGTAMTALAERLAGEGHEVHVFLCPWGDHHWHQIWADHWEARGCRVHHHPLRAGWTLSDASMFIADALNATDWDVIHFAENDGLGAPVQLLRSAGLAFKNTQVVVTAHGPTRWHRHGNLVQWTRSEALGSELEATSIELADAVVCPSGYIAEWCKARYATPAPPIVVPNSLTGEGRRFGRGPRERRPIRKIVFFGRLEVRKGIDRFIAAINRVIERGLSDFEVVFLGSFVSYYPLSELERRTETWPCQKRILENYTSHDAIDLLRTEDCIAVMPSRLDNSPYCVFECLDNAVPFIATDVGGTAELIREDDRARVLVSGDPEEIAEKLVDALQNGAAPAAMSFDPTLADIDLLALHGNLVDKARASRGRPARRAQSKASVIVYGPKADLAAPPLAEWLGRVGGASVEVMWCIGRGPDTEADWYGNADALNDAARSASHERLFFCHTSTLPDPDALTALLAAMDETGADAAVCGYRFQSADGISESVAVFAAPAELSTQQNIYGARLFLVRKAAFLEAGGFSDEPSAAGIMEWEFLNRLKAAGRRIIGIPIAMASTTGAVAPEMLAESQAGALTAPWTEAAPLHLQGFMRMALHPDRPAKPIPHPVSFRGEWTVRDPKPAAIATAGPAIEDRPADAGRIAETIGDSEILSAASPLDGIDVADDSLNRAGRLRIGSDGRLLDASETYRIQTAADADACNFLVAENLLDAEQASLLAEAFRDVEGQILRANGSELPAKSFLWMREISAKRPDAVDPLVPLIKNGMARTAEFYGLETPLFPDLIQLRKLGTGMSAMPVRRTAPPHSYTETDAPGFAGHLFLNDDYVGGALYFTGLDMAVEPKLGRFVAATSGAYHEQALLRVDSGSLLVLSFVMQRRREQISPDLRKIF